VRRKGALKRTTRVRRAAALTLTKTDLAMLEDLYAVGVATTPIALLLRRSHDPKPVGGMANHRRRIAALFHDGYLSRFDDRFGIVVGSRTFIYAVESGVAAGASATRTHYRDIDATTWATIRSTAEPLRERLVELLATRGHAPTTVQSRIDQIATLCMRYYSGEGTLRHKLLAATAAAILWLGARARKIEVHTVLPDGALAIAVPREAGGIVSLKPDLFFGLGPVAVFIEAETGTSSRAKVAAKLAQYSALFGRGIFPTLAERTGVTFSQVRILVHCATDAHAQLVADLAMSQSAPLRDALRITGPADLTTDAALLPVVGKDGECEERPLSAKDFIENSTLRPKTTVYSYFESRIDAEIFAAVTANDASGPALYCTRFLPEGKK
jgi:hypothetical protein